MNDISLFDFIDELEPEDIQKEVVAADLSMLLVHSSFSRSQLATDLECRKSRISRILSGDENLTLKTLTKVAHALGYTFDVVFYNDNYPKPKQPWHIDRLNKGVQAESKPSKPLIEIKVQNSKDVFEDFMAGKDADYYISFNELPYHNKAILKQTAKSIPTSKKSFYYDLPISSSHSFISNVERIKQNG